MKLIVKESTLKRIVESVLLEYYDSEKLYSYSYVVDRLSKAPKSIKQYINVLPKIDCVDASGNQQTCTRIPEVVYVYLSGRY